MKNLTTKELSKLKGGRKKYYIKYGDTTVEVSKAEYDCVAGSSH